MKIRMQILIVYKNQEWSEYGGTMIADIKDIKRLEAAGLLRWTANLTPVLELTTELKSMLKEVA